jgi:hypothetical protein
VNKLLTYVILAGATAILLFAAGCSNDKDSNPAASNETDQTALQALMTEDSDLEGVNAWDGDSTDGGGSLDSAVTPIRWFRRGAIHRSAVNVEIDGDSIATITRTAAYNGVIRVLVDTAGGTRVWINKDMHNVVTRKAHARRIGHNPRPRENWRIYEVTPEVMLSAAPDSNTVRPVRVKYYVADDSLLTQIRDITDPLNTYFRRDSLPEIPRGATLVVQVTPSITDTVAAFLHQHIAGHLPRLPMAPSDNNTYTVAFSVGLRPGIHFAAPDLISRATLHTSEGGYDAGSWAIPYRVTPATN